MSNRNRRRTSNQPVHTAQTSSELVTGEAANHSTKDGDKVSDNNLSERELYVKLLEHYQKSFQNRREVEWKLALGFWAAIGAITYSLITVDKDTFVDSDCLLAWLFAGYVIVGIVSVFFWKFPLQHSNASDSLWQRYFRNRAEGKPAIRPFGTDPKTEKEHNESIWNWPAELGRKQWVWLVGQISFTAITLIGSYIVIALHFAKPTQSKPDTEAQTSAAITKAADAATETAAAVNKIADAAKNNKPRKSWISIEIGK